MSDVNIKKVYTIKKTVPSEIYFTLSPISNPNLVKQIYLTNRLPQQSLPEDWALGIFANDALYNMYKQGYFTFDDNDALVKAAQVNGVYFDEVLDFTPASEKDIDNIYNILKKGNRPEIMAAMDKYGQEKVKNVAISKHDSLPLGVVNVLEGIFGIQLTLDGGNN